MQSVSEEQLVGRTLGEYRIERLLGHGQLSAVYLAQHAAKGRAVMITTFKFPEGITPPVRAAFSKQFAREGAALVALKHSNMLPTYDFGEQEGRPYLVTAFVRGASLFQAQKQQGRFTPGQTYDVLKQLSAGLEYAHNNGVVHGMLSLSNVLIGNDLVVQIAGFGLRSILDVHAGIQNGQPQAHLFSVNGTFLGSPEYISPERVLGRPCDARSDIYALGVMLFELLSGSQPFSGSDPLDIALKRIRQPVPSLHALCQDVPEAFDVIVSKAMEPDPAKRYQHAGEIVSAFERVFKVTEAAARPVSGTRKLALDDPQITLPPTVNWFEDEVIPDGRWQLMPPIVTGRMPVVAPSDGLSNPAASSLHSAPTEMFAANTDSAAPNPAHSMAGVDPFALWSANPSRPLTPTPEPGTFARRLAGTGSAQMRGRRKSTQQDRRKLVAFIAAGGAAVSVMAVGGISFAHFVQSMKQSQTAVQKPTTGTTSMAGTGKTPTTSAQNSPTTAASPTARPSPSPTQKPSPSPTHQPTPKPTQPPKPTPTQPSHTGTVIGYTSLGQNSSKNFTNPADGTGSILIHLTNGNFVACENPCTHVGVPVYYDGGRQKLVCPAHGAIFDPFNNFSQVPGQGPSNLANLRAVSIRVNADGTITTG